jgi:hypothetical protein
MIITANWSALRITRPREYAIRFILGGLACVVTGIIANVWGPTIGGLFLAFPAIFCASATLVEKHERERKEHAGLSGRRRGRNAAALESMGSALGCFGLLAFAGVMSRASPQHILPTFVLAVIAWGMVSFSVWWVRRYLRRS